MKRYMLGSVFIMMLLSVILPMPIDAKTITTCDFDTLKATIEGLNADDGGIIIFDCAGTIRFTETLIISSDITVNGADNVIFDGYGLYTLFDVRETFTLHDGIVQTAWTAIRSSGTLTITDSLFRDNQAYDRGSAIVNMGVATITNSTFMGNETDEGGVIWNGGTLTITDSQFVRNKAYSHGGAIYNEGDIIIAGSQFSQNDAPNGNGGAIHNWGNLTIETSTFTDNHARSGGVIANWDTLDIRESIFRDNHSSSGGGVLYGAGSSVILNSQFVDNGSSWGGVIAAEGDVTIRSSYFEGNEASSSGGVITKWAYWDSEEGLLLSISHNTFIENRADEQGGVIEYQNTSQVFINNNTFATNQAQFGGAIYGGDTAGASILHNTFVDNEGIGGALYINSPANIRYNLLSGTPETKSQCSGLYGQDIDATNLTDYRCGGAGQVDNLMLGEFDGLAFPLLDGSPAIDGYPKPCQISHDQLGIPRPRADACDIGAVEWLPEGDVVITEAQSLTLTDCTWDSLSEAIINLNWAGGDIQMDCPENTTITFMTPLVVYGTLTIISDTPIQFDGDNETQLLVIDATGELTLTGITIINGSHQMGGAIRNDGNLHISELTFMNNNAQQGGAIWNNGDLTITNSQFDSNHAPMGGAIYNLGALTITDSTFINHEANKGTEDKFKPQIKPSEQEEEVVFEQVGGAIFTNSQTSITNSRFENNWASEAGGAIFIDKDGVLNITNCHLVMNEAKSGGALFYVSNPEYEPLGYTAPQNQLLSQPSAKNVGYRYKPVVQYRPYNSIYDSVFEANSATDGGAIYNTTWLQMTIRDNLFTRNEALASGGAIFDWGDATIYQNTFIENHADKGGAMYGSYGWNNTFLRNSAITEGGALYGGVIVYSTFVDNTAPVGGAVSDANLRASVVIGDAPQCENTSERDEITNFSSSSCGNAIVIPRDYLLLGEFDGRVFPLLSGSPLIDALESCPSYRYGDDERELVDQLGTQRPQGLLCDVGAVEVVGESISTLENLIVTDCTFERLSQAIVYVPILSEDIQLNCPEDAVITFTEPLLIIDDVSITNIGAEVSFDGGGETYFFKVDKDISLTLDGVTLRNGFNQSIASGSAVVNSGELHILNSRFEDNIHMGNNVSGAILNSNDGHIIIENSVFTRNSTYTSGSVIMNYGEVFISDSVFSDNQANSRGGAIQNYNKLVMSDTQFTNNHAVNLGGAIYNEGVLIIRRNQFTMNSANQGGGVFIKDNAANQYSAQIEDSVFDGNIAENGGAIYIATEASLDVNDSQFTDNSVQVDGGAIYIATQAESYIYDSQFIGNSAQMNGGAIYHGGAIYEKATASRSTFFQNTADAGGAVVNVYIVTNSTFVENRAISKGGAILGGGAEYTTFVDNTAPLGGAIAEAFLYTSIVSGVDSQCHDLQALSDNYPANIADVACGDALVVDDLRLGEFDGMVIPPLADSPAIDILPLRSCPSLRPDRVSFFMSDQLDTTRPQGNGCDFGAVEFVPDTP